MALSYYKKFCNSSFLYTYFIIFLHHIHGKVLTPTCVLVGKIMSNDEENFIGRKVFKQLFTIY